MSDKFGINVKRYCHEHEAAMACLPPIHLIVVVMTAFAELFAVDLTVLHPQTNPLAAIVMLALAILLGFYFAHYFFLENTVQRWYKLADALRERMR